MRMENIHFDKEERRPANSIVVNYSSLLNDSDFIRDNAAMMLLNLLIKIMPGEVLLAGLDGYRIGADNYYQQRLDFSQCGESYLIKNQEIKNKIASLSRVLRISFVTPSLYK